MAESNWFESVYPEEVYAFPPPLTVVLSMPLEKLGEQEKVLLSRMLQAIRHSLDSVKVVVEPRLDLSAWIEKPRQILAFQPPPKGIEPYSVTQAAEATVLFSAPLEVLSTDTESKKKLWAALQTMFPG